MRTPLSGELATLALPHVNPYIKVESRDSDGTWHDLAAVSGEDWVLDCTWTDNIDNPGVTGSFTVQRENVPTGKSMAPLMTGSSINRNALGAYAPFINVGTFMRVSTAVVAAGGAVSTWREQFQGVINSLTLLGSGDTGIKCDFRDLMGALIDQQIEVVRAYGSPSGVAVETIMQSILTDNATGVTLVTPVSPAWDLLQYAQDKVGIYEAIHALTQQIGYDVRYKYDATNVYGLTFYAPARTKTISDATIGPGQYDDVKQFVLDETDVRNAIDVIYTDAVTGARTTQSVTDSTSIAKYGRRYMAITEDTASNINSAAQALALANAALADLAEPSVMEEISLIFWPLVELGDLYTLSANGVHYDTDQQRAVISYTHNFTSDGHATTTIQTRGKPSSQYMNWLSMQGSTLGMPQLDVRAELGLSAVTIVYSGSDVTLSIDGGVPTVAPASPFIVPRDVVDHIYMLKATGPLGQRDYPVNIPAAFRSGPEVSVSVDASGSLTVHIVGRSGAASTQVLVRPVTVGTKQPTAAEIIAGGTNLAAQTGDLPALATLAPFGKVYIGAVSKTADGVYSDPKPLEYTWLGVNATPVPSATFGTPVMSANLAAINVVLSAQAQRFEMFMVESITDLTGGTGVAVNVENIAADVYDWIERAKDGSYNGLINFSFFRPGNYVNITGVVTDVLGNRGIPVNLMFQVPATPPTNPTTPTAPTSVTTTATNITANCLIPSGTAVTKLRRYVDGVATGADVTITAGVGANQSVDFGDSFLASSNHNISWSVLTAAGVESGVSPTALATLTGDTSGGGGGTTSNGKLAVVTALTSSYSVPDQQVVVAFTPPSGLPSGVYFELWMSSTGSGSGYADTANYSGASPVALALPQSGPHFSRWFKIVTRCTGWTDSDLSAFVAQVIPDQI